MDEVGNQFEMNYVEQGMSPQQRPADKKEPFYKFQALKDILFLESTALT